MSRTRIQPKPSARRGFQQDPRSDPDTRQALAVCAVLVVAVLLLFSRTLNQGFFHIDDNLFVYDEPHVAGGLTWSGVGWAFTNGPLGEWYPLTMLSHMLDCQLYGLNPLGHHLTSVVLHAASSALLFLVLWRMTGALWPSAVVATLFALHPLRVEPVAWVASRRDVLSGLFFMLTLGAYVEYVRHPRSIWRYLAVVIFFALGLMSKAILVTLPPLLLLLDYWPLARFRRISPDAAATTRPAPFSWRPIVDKLPLFALAIADAGITMRTHGMLADSLTWAERFANAIISYVVYLGQLFVPMGLSVFNAHPEEGRPVWQVAAALGLLLAITAAVVIGRRAYPYCFVGWFWYVGMLVPVLGLAFVGPQSRADRYTYLSQIGIYIALVWGAAQLGAKWPARRWVFGIASALMLVALTACSWRQLSVWKSDQTLWEHALACYPNSATVHFFLGNVLQGKDEEQAIAHYRQALEIGPNDRLIYAWPRDKALGALAAIATRKGDIAGTIAEYEQGLAVNPNLEIAQMSLGNLLARQGKLDEAIVHFQKSIDLASDGAPAAHCNLGIALSQQDKKDEAIASFREALQADRNLTGAHLNLAILLAQGGKLDEAFLHFRRAAEIEPDYAFSYFQIAQLLRQQDKLSEAMAYEERGQRAKRRHAETQNLRGTELAQKGKLDEAIAQFQMALASDPNLVIAHTNLAKALALQGKIDDAIAQYRQALSIDPDFAPAKQSLDQLLHD